MGILKGPVVLDSEGVSRLGRHDRHLYAVVEEARESKVAVVTSSSTVVEAFTPGIRLPALSWALSRIEVVDVTKATAAVALELLASTGRHGHKDALDAILVAVALALPSPPMIFTSDPDDIRALCGTRASVVALR